MSDKPISPLRQRLIDDMTARRYSEKVQKAYVRHVRTFTAFLGRSPDTATKEDVRGFQLHLAQQQISPGSINAVKIARGTAFGCNDRPVSKFGIRLFFAAITVKVPATLRPPSGALPAQHGCRARSSFSNRGRSALAPQLEAPQRL